MVLFSDVRNQVLLRLGLANATYISVPEINSYLNYSFAELVELIIESNEDWNVTRFSFSIPDNNANTSYQLPDDFYKVLRVDRFVSSDQAYILNRINIRDENLYGPSAYNYNTCGASGYNTEVDGYGKTQLRVFPTAQKQGNYRILYYPAFTDYVDVNTVIMGPPGQKWEEYAILDTMIKICGKDETDPSLYLAQKAAVINRIKAAAAARDIGQAEPPPTAGGSWWEKGQFGGGNRGGSWY
jgi:hypothetical protein